MGIQPRYLSATALAQYLDMSRNMVDALVRSGKLPKPVYLTTRMPRWDREQVDAALARSSKSTDPIMDKLDAAFPPQHRPTHA